MEQLISIYSYLMGPVDAIVAFGGTIVGSAVTLATDSYNALLR